MTNKSKREAYGEAVELTPAEIERLLRVAGKGRNGARNVMMIKFAYNCALRIGEVCSATIGDLFDADGLTRDRWQLSSSKQKGKKTTYIDLNTAVRKQLTEYFQNEKVFGGADDPRRSPERPVFPSLSPKSGFFMSANAGQMMINSLFKEAGIVGGRSHSLRRTKATEMNRMGVRVPVIQKSLRHANLSTTQRYMSTTHDELRNATELAAI